MTQSDLHISIPPYANAVLDALEHAGYEAWLVGGCVRDSLLKRPVNDYDIATSAEWTEVERIAIENGFAVHRTGAKHGTVTVVVDDQPIEITTYRAEMGYSDGRHPDKVQFVRTIEEDLARRDFTVNALAYHPARGLLDCLGGTADLQSRTIRTVGAPPKRFSEDGLRVLRACRFASQLGFSIDPDTLAAMEKWKTKLFQVSAERITHEMDLLLLGDHVHDALMETFNVLTAVMPEIAACKGFDQHTPYHIYDVWEHTAWVVHYAPATRLARWSALFHDIGKPAAFYCENGRGHFFGHPKISALLAAPIMERLLFSPAFQAKVLKIVRLHDYQVAPTTRSVKKMLARLDGDVELFRTLCGVKRADALAQSDLNVERLKLAEQLPVLLDEVLATNDAFTLRQLAVSGNDVLAMGVPAGPEVGRLLNLALNEVIDENLPNERDSLLAFLQQHM